MALKDRWVQAEVNELLERRLSPNPLVTIHKYPGADHAFARCSSARPSGNGAYISKTS
jgi:carboxymethylenebutenolidase